MLKILENSVKEIPGTGTDDGGIQGINGNKKLVQF